MLPFKMLPKCSLDVPNIVALGEHSANIVTLRGHSVNIVTQGEHSVNIPGISRAGWEGFSGDRKMLMLL